ncbi:hypothetical protein LG276_21455 [Cytobacillus kochii]|uniref:hypothetical protein n=1 Tax=Cytobacillus TaxID=2675230 RepID=UPI0024810A98|nr:hypothetical protein [Cytobacillus kochii]
MQKDKVKLLILLLGSVFIMGAAMVIMLKIYNQHVENEQIIERCYEESGDRSLTIEKNGVFSKVSCKYH